MHYLTHEDETFSESNFRAWFKRNNESPEKTKTTIDDLIFAGVICDIHKFGRLCTEVIYLKREYCKVKKEKLNRYIIDSTHSYNNKLLVVTGLLDELKERAEEKAGKSNNVVSETYTGKYMDTGIRGIGRFRTAYLEISRKYDLYNRGKATKQDFIDELKKFSENYSKLNPFSERKKILNAVKTALSKYKPS